MTKWRGIFRTVNQGRLFLMGHLHLDLSNKKEPATAMGASLGRGSSLCKGPGALSKDQKEAWVAESGRMWQERRER